MFDVRKSCAMEEYYESLWYLDTYDFARGLALCGHSCSPSATLVEPSEGRVFPFLDPSASPVGVAFLFFSPPAGGGEVSSSSSSSSREECALESSDDKSDTSRRRALFRVPVDVFLAFFSGTT